MFAEMFDGVWQHLTCPAILGVVCYLIGVRLEKLTNAIAELHAAIREQPEQTGQKLGPPPKIIP